MRFFRIQLVALLVAAFGLIVGPLSSTAIAAGKVALVLDVGGRGDLSFNDMGFKGADEAVAKFGVELVEIQSNSAADYLPNLQNAARSGEFDVIVAVVAIFVFTGLNIDFSINIGPPLQGTGLFISPRYHPISLILQ